MIHSQPLPASVLRWLNQATSPTPPPEVPTEAAILARHSILSLDEASRICDALGPERAKEFALSLIPQEEPRPPKNAFLRYFRLSSLAFWR